MRTAILFSVCLFLPVTLSAGDAPAKADRPSDYLLLPTFEVDTVTADGLTTFYAVHNLDDLPQDVRILYRDTQGVVQVSEDLTLAGHQTRTVDLRSVVGLPIEPDGIARGSVEIMYCPSGRQPPEPPMTLVGDYFFIDSSGDFANGDQLLREVDVCDQLLVRIIDFGSASKLRLYSTEPQGAETPTATYLVYDEGGTLTDNGALFVDENVEVFDSTVLTQTRFGTLVVDFVEGAGALLVEYSAFGRFSVTMNANCTGQSIQIPNPCTEF